MKTVTIIEDTEAIQSELPTVLRFEGCKPFGARNGPVRTFRRYHLRKVMGNDKSTPC